MPVDLSGKEKEKRSGKRISTLQDHDDHHRAILDTRRARGEIACAECNRLKLRCDKKIPCSSCSRRGCAAICPNSALSGGQGTRLVLADTEQLHQKLAEMSERIRQLEDALGIETAHSPERHPLLREELLAIKRGIPNLRREGDSPSENLETAPEDEIFDNFGTLTVADDGVSRFIGRTGSVEGVLMAELNIQETDLQTPRVKNGFRHADDSCSASVHKGQSVDEDQSTQIIDSLPSYERGWTLAETYLEQSSWFVQVVQRDQLIDELFTPIYAYKNASDTEREAWDPINPHEVALLLMIFSMGALADLTLQPFNDEADRYYHIARTIVDLEVASETPSLTIVQVLITMTTYCAMSDRMYTVERSFSTLNFASVLAIAIGLHRDPKLWKFDDRIAERRRHVFWQLFSIQNWQGLASGRPTIFTLTTSDCQLPQDSEAAGADKDVVGYWRFRYILARDVLHPINRLTCAVAPVKYSEILELDRMVREAAIPPNLQIPEGGSNWESDGPFKVMERFLPALWRDSMFLYIHRSYFTRALLDFPANPLRSPYAASFLSAYRSSLSLLKLSREHYGLCPDFMVRSWLLWKHVFSALVIVGTIVIRGPNSSLAPAALVELTIGIGFFEKSAAFAEWARRALVVLHRLRDKALNVYSQYRDGNMNVVQDIASRVKREDMWVNELAIFGGQSRAVRKLKSKRKQPIPDQMAENSNALQVDLSEMSTFVTEATESTPSSGASPDAPVAHNPHEFPDVLFPPSELPLMDDQPLFSFPEPMDFSNIDPAAQGDPGMYSFLPFEKGPFSDGSFTASGPENQAGDFMAMDERWSSFLQDSGLLVGSPLAINFNQ